MFEEIQSSECYEVEGSFTCFWGALYGFLVSWL